MLTLFAANRYKHTRWAQASFFVLSVASGTRMIYQVNHGNWLVNMQQVSDSLSNAQTIFLKTFATVPTAGDHLGLYYNSTGSWTCSAGPGRRGPLGVVDGSATSLQLVAYPPAHMLANDFARLANQQVVVYVV
jgi:hypothetical protein